MKKSDKLINEVLKEFENGGANLQRMNEIDLRAIFSVCDSKNYIVWINNYATISPTFINNYATKYYGFNNQDLKQQGFKLYESCMHPDNFNDFHKGLSFFTNYPKEIYEATFRVKGKGDEWRWIHATSKAINYDENGKIIFLLSVAFDIADMVEIYYKEEFLNSKEAKFVIENRPLYNNLTKRERQILHLIGEEQTSQEIAEVLDIKSSTVDTHRKKMIKKLNCKSSFGLAKYAIYFRG